MVQCRRQHHSLKAAFVILFLTVFGFARRNRAVMNPDPALICFLFPSYRRIRYIVGGTRYLLNRYVS